MVVIGLTGSLLVFARELERYAYRSELQSTAAKDIQDLPEKTIPAILMGMKKNYPTFRITVLYVPERVGDRYQVFALDGMRTRYLFAEPQTGEVQQNIDSNKSWMTLACRFTFSIVGRKDRIYCEWHWRGMPAAAQHIRHDRLVERAAALDARVEGGSTKELEEDQFRFAWRGRLLDFADRLHVGLHRGIFCLA